MFRLIRELRRRKVFRGAAIYLVSAWMVLQIVDVTGEAAGLPGWTMRVLLYAAVIGFPLAVFLGWRYEFGEHGVVKTKPVGSDDPQQPPGTKDYVAIALMIAVSVAAAWQIIPSVIDEPPVPVSPTEHSVNPNSIAVLPFVEIGQANDGFLADGLGETLTHVLGQIEELAVTARTSTLVFKERSENILNIAKELRVAYVVEGSVQQAGLRVRIIARLIESKTGTELWSATMNKQVEDIFEIQDEISRDVVAALRGVLGLDDIEMAKQYQPDLEAYRELVLGINAQRNDTLEGIARARKHFERALELDPEYALAYVKLGENVAKDSTLPRSEMIDAVRPLLDKALALQPDLAEVHVALSVIHRFSNQPDRVEPALKRALELNPSSAEAHLMYSSWLVLEQRLEESLVHARIAADLDRMNPQTQLRLSSAYWNLARAEQAISVAREIVEKFPDFPYSYNVLARWYLQLGEPGRSLLYTHRLYELDPENPRRISTLCGALWQLWDFDGAIACRRDYLARFPDDLEVRKQLAAELGDYAEAIRIADEHAKLESWSEFRKVQLAYFVSLTRDHARVLEVLRDASPALFRENPEINDFSQWPARMAAQAMIETGESERGLELLARVEEHVERARKMQGGGWLAGIEDAQILAIRGERAEALDALEAAVGKNWSFYSATLADNRDPHLDSIAGAARYKAVVDRLRERMADERAWFEANKDHLPE